MLKRLKAPATKKRSATKRDREATDAVLNEPWFSSTASRELKSLEPLFKKLRSLHDAYNEAELCNGDCSFWYNERPHVGFLATAVWQHGGTALAEFRAAKPTGLGRADLFFRIRKNRFDCEAKHIRVKLEFSRASGKVRDGLERAIKDAQYVKPEKSDDKVLALCFVSPEIRESHVGELKDRLHGWIESAKDNRQCHALVWIGLPEGKEPITAKGRVYPGLFLVISEVK
jgi:hypothetical protein